MLDQIISNKKREIAELKKAVSLSMLKKIVSGLNHRRPRFAQALVRGHEVSVIAEIKRRSPSKGLLRSDFNPAKLAKSYQEGGAAAISVLTDMKFFGGSAEDLVKVRKAVTLPILRKDFTIDEYQIYEARILGADAVLLIAAVLSIGDIKRFQALAHRLGMDALVEVHSASELKKALAAKPSLVGINNRNLKDFSADIRTTQKLATKALSGITLVSESGISTHKDILVLQKSGIRAVLVGEALMKKKNVKNALLELRGLGRG